MVAVLTIRSLSRVDSFRDMASPGAWSIDMASLRARGIHAGLPPPLWGRDGVGGVVHYGTAVPHLPTPTPSPQGGGEEFAAPANLNLTAIGSLSLRHDSGRLDDPSPF